MQVILNEDHPSLGFVGDIVNVKPGFARNFLFPKKIAVPADAASIHLFEHRKRQLEIKKAKRKQDAEVFKKKIEGTQIKIIHAATEDNKLFGSVTVTELQEQLKETGVDVDRKLIRLEAPIKQTGEYEFQIKLHQEVSANLKVIVEKKEEEKKAEAPKKTTKKAAPKASEEAKEPVKEENTEAQAEQKTEE